MIAVIDKSPKGDVLAYARKERGTWMHTDKVNGRRTACDYAAVVASAIEFVTTLPGEPKRGV